MLKVNAGISLNFLKAVHQSVHCVRPHIFLRCSMCSKTDICFCESCVYTLPYGEKDSWENLNDDKERIDVLINGLENKAEWMILKNSIILTDETSYAMLCGIECLKAWRFFPQTDTDFVPRDINHISDDESHLNNNKTKGTSDDS